ncbi:MAG: DUF167 domain-containing protein [Planctomycetaceae bacterium]
MLDLTNSADGVLLPVIAQPGARRDGLVGIHDGRLKVAVAQVAEKGKANARIIRVLAASVEIKRSQIVLRSGAAARHKVFVIQGITLEDLHERLRSKLGP